MLGGAYADPFATPGAGGTLDGAHGGGTGYDMHGPAAAARDGGYQPPRSGSPPPQLPIPAAVRHSYGERHGHVQTSSYEPLLGAAGLGLAYGAAAGNGGGNGVPPRTPGSPGSPGSAGDHAEYFPREYALPPTPGTSGPPALPPRSPLRKSQDGARTSVSPALVRAAPPSSLGHALDADADADAGPPAFSRASSVYSDDGDEVGTVHEHEPAAARGRLEVRNPGVSRSSTQASRARNG
jgi:hypothetical protein